MRGTVVVVMLVTALSASSGFAETSLKEDGREVGQGLKKLGKDTGKAFKEGGREVGQGFKKLGKETGAAFREGGRESGQATKKAGRSVGEWFRDMGHSIKSFFKDRFGTDK
ncbi:hypothetical protein [Geobacter sp. AOG2]|uniref:hypothetical protein n=1 Tax=Geobacter sp. AOG2 TaxID=1566347 RepID=UPI001CC6CC02|nr:hypothetical protein [Geobacter sp. AOG2]GFE61738.1 lipoprotein [Geobacter sp. AOG2]